METNRTMERGAAGAESGFTLIEIAIAAFLLQIGLMAIASGFMVHSRAADETRDADLRTLACRNVIEILRDADFDNLVVDYGPGGADTFWCDEDGNVSFATPSSGIVAKGSITLYDDIATIPASFADLDTVFDPNIDPASALFDLGVLPVRLSVAIGADVTTVDILLSRGGF